jgi:hypothetical protein
VDIMSGRDQGRHHPEIEPVLHEALAARRDEQDQCLSLESLMDLADGSARGEQRAALSRHVQSCPACACLLAELRVQTAPVRALHRGWLGWKGVLLSSWGRLPGTGMEVRAWQQHLQHCPRCRHRSMLGEGFLGRIRGAWYLVRGQVPGLVSGAVLVLLAVVLIPSGIDAPQGSEPTPPATQERGEKGPKKEPDRGAKRGPKGGPKGGPAEPDPGTGLSPEQLLAPAPEQLPAAIAFWEAAADRAPDDLAVLEKLDQLYARQAEQQPDETSRRPWLDKQHQISKRLQELRTQPKP